MPVSVSAVILVAAALHAAWNAIVKGAGDKALMTVLVAATAALLSAAVLPWLPAPSAASYPYILASGSVHVLYFALVARAYNIADMGQMYPLMRGSAVMLTPLAGIAWLGDHLSAGMWSGIGIICLGIFLMMAGTRGNGSGVRCALANALVITAYTLLDGTGVRASGSPIAYTLWVFLIPGPPLAAWGMLTRRAALLCCLRAHWRHGLLGGLGMLASYGLALWAMTKAPVAVVAALRETSIVFGVAISALLLKERVSPARGAAACLIAIGAVVLRLA